VGALYRYYASKDALIAALEMTAVQRVESALLDGQNAERNAIDNLYLLAMSYTLLPTTNPQEFGLVSLMLGDPMPYLSSEDAQPVMDAVTPFLERVAKLFQGATEAGTLSPGDAMDRTLVYWMAIHGNTQIIKLGRFDPHLFSPQRLVQIAVRALMMGWGASATTLERLEKENSHG
jgi:AcrR family transcriptional regulator